MEFIKRNYQLIVLIMLLLILGVSTTLSVMGAVFPRATQVSRDVIGSVIGDVLDEKVEPLEEALSRIESKLAHDNNYSVILMAVEMNTLRSSAQVDARIDFLEENKWNAQIAAMKYLSEDSEARAALKKMVPNEEVYLALLTRIMRY